MSFFFFFITRHWSLFTGRVEVPTLWEALSRTTLYDLTAGARHEHPRRSGAHQQGTLCSAGRRSCSSRSGQWWLTSVGSHLLQASLTLRSLG